MLRQVMCAFALAALAGCAVTNTPYPRPTYPAAPPVYRAPPVDIYAGAASAPIHSMLFLCRSGYVSNSGSVGERGDVLTYSPYIDTPAGALLRAPTEQACLSSGYGWRGTDTGGGRNHNGADLANPQGGFIYAAGEGRIVTAGWLGGYGNAIEIDHGYGVRTLYAHLNEINPIYYSGAWVAAGAPIGRMGMTGNATGIHLHYEVTVDGARVDPMSYGSAYQAPVVTPVFNDNIPEPLLEAPPVASERIPPPLFDVPPVQKTN